MHGTLEVLLVGAKGLENTDYLCKQASAKSSMQDSPFSCSLFNLVHCFHIYGDRSYSNNWSIAQLTLIGRWINH